MAQDTCKDLPFSSRSIPSRVWAVDWGAAVTNTRAGGSGGRYLSHKITVGSSRLLFSGSIRHLAAVLT